MTGKPYRLGLTGSIGMGKSTTARLFADEGVPVWDADAAVHQLYGPGGAGVPAISVLVSDAVSAGAVDRTRLRRAVGADLSLLPRIEAAIHPLVAETRTDFIALNMGHPVLLFDIPLLFETGADAWFDGTVVVTAPAEIQRSRVLERPGMTEEHFQRILSRQMPDAEKRARADYLVRTGEGLEPARAAVRAILQDIARQQKEDGSA
jgi:dephospho-CoA kinase